MGMIVPKKDKKDDYYDRFRDRLMFPIHNAKGSVIGFGGRVLSSQDNPKYLNSPETPLFSKSKELYGLYHCRKYSRRIDSILVVEGLYGCYSSSPARNHQCCCNSWNSHNASSLADFISLS
jgi:DNA primase